jgi:predicted CXXCH cytochrome family protein
MIRYLRLLAASVPLLAAGFALGDITGSKHDFSAQDWSDNEICKPCHTPHNADISLTGRLWAHTMSTATYTYHGGTLADQDGSLRTDGATGVAAQSDMDSASRLCLSCHDGTVALDSFKGKVGGSQGVSISTLASGDGLYNPNIGGGTVGGATADLSNDHPVGYKAVYDEMSGVSTGHARYKPVADATAVGIKFATSKTAATGNGLDGNPRTGNLPSVSCVSCHNVHNSGASDERGLLRASNVGSELCLSCHNK